MCGRIILTLTAKLISEMLAEEYGIDDLTIEDFVPKYNLGPSQDVLSIIAHEDKYRSGYLKWRFIPSYAKSQNDGYKCINARSETIHEKVTYKEAFKKRRCLVLCNGFYEWKQDGIKRPFLFHRPDFKPIVMAGIWQPQYLDDGTKEYGTSIVTTAANDMMASIHHRMPVILKPEEAKIWLNKHSQMNDLQSLMQPIEEAYLQKYEVSTQVNNARFQDPSCITKIGS